MAMPQIRICPLEGNRIASYRQGFAPAALSAGAQWHTSSAVRRVQSVAVGGHEAAKWQSASLPGTDRSRRDGFRPLARGTRGAARTGVTATGRGLAPILAQYLRSRWGALPVAARGGRRAVRALRRLRARP